MNFTRFFAIITVLPVLAACTKTVVDTIESDALHNGAGQEITLSSEDERFSVDENGVPQINFHTSGGTVVVMTKTNHICEYSCTSSEEWIEADIDNISGLVSVTVGENTGKNDRNGRILVTVMTDADSSAVSVLVTQNGTGTPELRLQTPICTFPPSETYGECSKNVTVETNQDEWRFENDTNDWLNIVKDDEGLILTALPNTTSYSRATEIRVSAGSGDKAVTKTLTVRQDAVSFISVSNSFSISYDAVSTRIPIVSNYKWSAVSNESWVSATEDQYGNLLLSSETNRYSSESRQAVITISAGPSENNTAVAQMVVIQYGYNPSALVFELITFNAANTVYLPVAGNVDCIVDWGDGTVEEIKTEYPSHAYSDVGFHTASVTGTVTEINSAELPSFSYQYITGVAQWGRTGLKSMYRAFYGCLNLRFIAGDTERSFADVTTFEEAFYGCERLQTLPESLFSYAEKAASFYGTFQGCVLIPQIPEKLFANTGSAEIFRYTFYDCQSVKVIPETLFAGCIKATSFYGTFYKCTGLTSIPEKLFTANTLATSFGYVFYGCSSIRTIPEKLFWSCPDVTTFASAFGNCTALEEIPAGLFDMNKYVRIWSSTFYNCTSLKGESPYTEVGGVKIHLYERIDYPDMFTAPTTTSNCFNSDTGLTDYQNIPSNWL